MELFELLADPKQSGDDVVIFENDELQSVYNSIKQLFDENGYISERGGTLRNWYVPEKDGKKLLSNRDLSYQVSAKAGSLDASPVILDVVLVKLAEMEQKIQELNEDEQVQNDLIAESESHIEQSHIDYTSAIVRGDSQGVQSIETQAEEWQIAIKHAEIRKKAIKAADVELGHIVEIIKVMRDRVDYQIRVNANTQARKVFLQHLETLKTKHEEYNKAVNAVREGYGKMVLSVNDGGMVSDLIARYKRNPN